jgi:hypothetical protein
VSVNKLIVPMNDNLNSPLVVDDHLAHLSLTGAALLELVGQAAELRGGEVVLQPRAPARKGEKRVLLL